MINLTNEIDHLSSFENIFHECRGSNRKKTLVEIIIFTHKNSC